MVNDTHKHIHQDQFELIQSMVNYWSCKNM